MWVIGTMVIYTFRYKFHWTAFVPFIFYCLNNQIHTRHIAGEVDVSAILYPQCLVVSMPVWLVMKTLCTVITANCGLIIPSTQQ